MANLPLAHVDRRNPPQLRTRRAPPPPLEVPPPGGAVGSRKRPGASRNPRSARSDGGSSRCLTKLRGRAGGAALGRGGRRDPRGRRGGEEQLARRGTHGGVADDIEQRGTVDHIGCEAGKSDGRVRRSRVGKLDGVVANRAGVGALAGSMWIDNVYAPSLANGQLHFIGAAQDEIWAHNDTTFVNSHTDTPHTDAHTDIAHSDAHTDIAHTDAHTDIAHSDAHYDIAFSSSHSNAHYDIAFASSHTNVARSVSHSDIAQSVSHTDIARSVSHSDISFVNTHTDIAHIDKPEVV